MNLLQVKGTAIKSINSLFSSSSGHDRASDEAIASVACLANANVRDFYIQNIDDANFLS